MRTWIVPPIHWGLAVLGLVPAQDPFLPGLRWSRYADPARPWIPKSVAIGADENVAFVACGGGSQRLEILSAHAFGIATPLASDASVATSSGALAVAAGRGTASLFSVAQFPNPDPQHRRTLAEGRSASGAVAWAYDPGFTTNGAARIACDESGATATLAVWDGAAGQVQVDRLDGASGTRLWSVRLAAAALNALAVSADGSRAAIAAGLDLWVVGANGATLHHSALASATQALAISGDGRRVATGDFGQLTLRADAGSGYATLFSVAAPPSEIATRAALSADGRTLAIGWWSWQTGTGLRFEAWDVAAGVRILHFAQSGAGGGLQNFPEAVRTTPDGRRFAFACWGDGTGAPDVLLFDRASPIPLLSIDLPGSAMALALDAGGTRVVVGTKDVHANQLGSTGEVRLYDTGERDLAVLAPVQAGGALELAAKRPGASTCFFLVGARSPTPSQVPGAFGSLWLVPGGFRIVARPADASGRADLSLPIAADPALVGTERHAQAAFRVGGALHLGATVVDALIL